MKISWIRISEMPFDGHERSWQDISIKVYDVERAKIGSYEE